MIISFSKSYNISVLLDLVVSDLRPVYLVLQHPSDSRFGHEEPGKNQQVNVERNESPQILQDGYFLEIICRNDREPTLVGDAAGCGCIVELRSGNGRDQGNIFVGCIAEMSICHR